MTGADINQAGQGQGDRNRAGMIRVMIVDDSLIARTVLRKTIEQTTDLVFSAMANCAEDAIEKLSQVEVDVILLDLEMPGMGGLAALPEILARARGARVIVISSLTTAGAETTVAALSMGAADTILKPRPSEFTSDYRSELAARIRAIGSPPIETNRTCSVRSDTTHRKSDGRPKPARVIAIGASTGGIHSMCQMLGGLSKYVDQPILISQHLPDSFMPVFARQLEIASSRKARIAKNGMALTSGEILIAPGDGHLTVEMKDGEPVVRIARHKVPNGCCPSVDPMLESLAECFEGAVLGIILSGMGRDGVLGARCVVDAGGTILVQNRETSPVWGMPRAIAEAGLASAILSPEELAIRVVSSRVTGKWA
ncbi:chemotaxis-specific protein-glutamate methyltransferase CheB [uncultured Parasphingorhabdus sp.]|uniref:chemotaxis-specific protein-glutamate methyltransferase CheB n=1 Tax=uncultured Parasphingorhabdus sp. TaxID=2709694 RepID=UPI0030D88196|tara:strand:+ start:5676 stop:6782 length:1107 start_codon:yes stop_codon:yes gene_type:complete